MEQGEVKKEVASNIKEEEKHSTPEPNSKDYAKVSVKKLRQEDILPILKLVAPGTALSSAIIDITKAKKGALIIVDTQNLQKIIEGGFRVNCRFTPQRLVELSKMDGAIILSKDMKKILYANTLLSPDIRIPTRETGTRHKAAERTAKQFKTIAIAVSERRNTITLYYENLRYSLKNSSEVLSRAIESLQLLEKHCEIFQDLLTNLNVLEFTNLATINDICLIIQRAEIILKISTMIRRYIVELGNEGVLLRIRLKELVKDIEKEEMLVIEDYSKLKARKTKNLFSVLSFEELLDINNILLALACKEEDTPLGKGSRLLSKAKIEQQDILKLVKSFKNLNTIFESPTEKLAAVLNNESKARKLQKDLIHMKEQVMLGKRI
ncbi:DNA integrity scanning diadenylate cyclase DisA [Candidatus Pacearchaeota archaeon]|nr:DNA integrity scanning diadenylate cyclase DisA [Candidatus Pacearchaeota archaeon]